MNEDTRHGQSLRRRCEARRDELELALGQIGPNGSERTREDIEVALNSIDVLFSGDLDHIGHMRALQLATWLEINKSLPHSA